VCWDSVWCVCELGASVCGMCECIANEWVGAMCVSDTHTHTHTHPHPHTHTHQKCEDVRGAWVGGWVGVGGCECVGTVCGVCVSDFFPYIHQQTRLQINFDYKSKSAAKYWSLIHKENISCSRNGGMSTCQL